MAQPDALFGRVPQVCAADIGYSSQLALEEMAKFNVPELCVPKKGRRNATQRKQRERTVRGSRWGRPLERAWRGPFRYGSACRGGIDVCGKAGSIFKVG